MGDMPTVCPNCGAKLRLPAASEGKKVRCPKCEKSFLVEAPDTEDAERPVARKSVVPAAKLSSTYVETDEERPRKASRRRKDDDDDDDRVQRKKSSCMPLTWLIAGGGAILLLLAGGAIATVLIIKSNKKDSSVAASSSSSESGMTTQQKLVGVWEVVKSDDLGGIDLSKLDKGEEYKMTVEFTKDGKFTV